MVRRVLILLLAILLESVNKSFVIKVPICITADFDSAAFFYNKLVNQSVEHYRKVTIGLFFGSTVNGVRRCALILWMSKSPFIVVRSVLRSVIRVQKSLRFETDLSHLECS